MEETHQKKIEDLQRQHQRELEKLREEKDRLLAEETAATISGGSWHDGLVSQRTRQVEDSRYSVVMTALCDVIGLRFKHPYPSIFYFIFQLQFTLHTSLCPFQLCA